MKNSLKKVSNILIIIFILFIIFILIDDIIGKSILDGSVYNSYELQTRAWLNWHTYLDMNYWHLELAIYNNHYFVSFPPFPSVLLIPFVIVFGEHVPSNLIMFFLFAMEFIVLYQILRKYKNTELVSILLASGFMVGSNLISLAIDSGVWFFAQLLNNLLCVLAINFFLNNKKTLVYLFLGLAVGCRPFSIIYLLMFFIYYVVHDEHKNVYSKILHNLVYLIPTIIIGIMYMAYNYIRFDSIFEFGHNYLPEFVNAEYGQFSLHYLLPNLKSLFFNPIYIDGKLNLSFATPFSFLIANPIIILYLYKTIKNVIKERKIDKFRLLIFCFMFINIIFICLHKTLGGWQFGSRYTCDILPFVFLGFLWYKDKNNNFKKINLDKFEITCIIFGIVLNIFGTIIMYSDMLYR